MQTWAVAVALLVGAPQAKDAPRAEPSLLGEWELQSRTVGGAPTAAFTRAGRLRYTFTDAGECVVSPGPGIPPSRYSFTADPKADPPAFALTQEVGGAATTIAGIYKVEGDTLTLCWDHAPGAARPKAFEAPAGTQVRLYVLQRVKAKD